LEGFSYVLQIDMHFICTPMWTKFYSCEKWVLQGDKPSSPQAERTTPDSPKPSSPKGVQGSLGAGGASTSLAYAAPDQGPAGTSSGLEPAEPPRASPQAPSPMDMGLLVGLSTARAHPCHNMRNLHNGVHGSQSLYGGTQTLSRPYFTSVGS
jgi:hypothetical protein